MDRTPHVDAFNAAFCSECSKADTIDDIAVKVGRIYHALYEGNGQPSVMTRLTVLENRVGATSSGLMVVLRDVVLPATMLAVGMIAGRFIK